MQNGDLSNRVSPRILIVFEGILAYCDDGDKFSKLVRKGRMAKALDTWKPHDLYLRRLLWLYWEKDINIDIVTFLPEQFVDESGMRIWLDEEIPHHELIVTTPEKLGRKIAYLPDIYCIYDPEPERWLMYGKKGRFCDSPSRIGEGL